jgi:hypothetical protein
LGVECGAIVAFDHAKLQFVTAFKIGAPKGRKFEPKRFGFDHSGEGCDAEFDRGVILSDMIV